MAELSTEARAQFRPAYCDFGIGPKLLELQEKVRLEREDARARKTSVRSDQIQLLPLSILRALPKGEVEFADLVKVEITRKGG